MPILKIDDTEFELTVAKYEIEREYDWSEIRITVKNQYMGYNDYGELLQKADVDEIIKTLNDLIYDKTTDEQELSFIEPDLTMQNCILRLHGYCGGLAMKLSIKSFGLDCAKFHMVMKVTQYPY